MKPLTDKQKLVLDFIEREIRINQQPPTIKEIARHIGSENTRSGLTHIEALIKKGYIERSLGQARSVRLTGASLALYASDTSRTFREVPLLGRIRAGVPTETESEGRETVPVPSSIFPIPPDYALIVRGDSMTGAGILDGDMAFVQKSGPFSSGEIVVAQIVGEMTLKYLVKEKGRIFLRSAHPDFPDREIPKSDSHEIIQGRMVGLLRRYRQSPSVKKL
jgi:repressor LexA